MYSKSATRYFRDTFSTNRTPVHILEGARTLSFEVERGYMTNPRLLKNKPKGTLDLENSPSDSLRMTIHHNLRNMYSILDFLENRTANINYTEVMQDGVRDFTLDVYDGPLTAEDVRKIIVDLLRLYGKDYGIIGPNATGKVTAHVLFGRSGDYLAHFYVVGGKPILYRSSTHIHIRNNTKEYMEIIKHTALSQFKASRAVRTPREPRKTNTGTGSSGMQKIGKYSLLTFRLGEGYSVDDFDPSKLSFSDFSVPNWNGDKMAALTIVSRIEMYNAYFLDMRTKNDNLTTKYITTGLNTSFLARKCIRPGGANTDADRPECKKIMEMLAKRGGARYKEIKDKFAEDMYYINKPHKDVIYVRVLFDEGMWYVGHAYRHGVDNPRALRISTHHFLDSVGETIPVRSILYGDF